MRAREESDSYVLFPFLRRIGSAIIQIAIVPRSAKL
jgi:hypothetical protein